MVFTIDLKTYLNDIEQLKELVAEDQGLSSARAPILIPSVYANPSASACTSILSPDANTSASFARGVSVGVTPTATGSSLFVGDTAISVRFTPQYDDLNVDNDGDIDSDIGADIEVDKDLDLDHDLYDGDDHEVDSLFGTVAKARKMFIDLIVALREEFGVEVTGVRLLLCFYSVKHII